MNRQRFPIRPILRANAVFSGISGLVISILPGGTAGILGLEQGDTVLFYVGLGLILFSSLLFFTAARTAISALVVLGVIVADALWVALSILLLVTSWIPLSAAGRWGVGVVALIVDLFATLQFLAWKQM